MTDRITHRQIMSEIQHNNDNLVELTKQVKVLNGTVTNNRIAIACIKTTAATISGAITLVLTLAITYIKSIFQ